MNTMPAVAGFPCDIPAKKRRYSSTAVGFPIRNDLSAQSQGISGVFPTWVRTRRAPTYVRGLRIDNESTAEHLPQDHTAPTNHLSNTTRSPLKSRTKPYTATSNHQANTRLSTPKRALIFAQIHPIFVEICLGFAWDSLEVVHNQFNTHSTQLAYSTLPTLSNQTSPIKTNQSNQASPIDTTQSSQESPIDTTQSNQTSPIKTTQSNQASPIDTTQSNQESPIVNVHSANDTSPTHQRHQADPSTTPSRPINDTEPTHQRHQPDSTWTNQGHHNDTEPTHQRHQPDSTWTNQGHHNDTNPTHQRHQSDPSTTPIRLDPDSSIEVRWWLDSEY